MDWKKYLCEWRDSYRNDLVNNIMPFWIKNGVDRVKGGVYTCLDRDGSLIDSTKSVWFQGRFAFVCSFGYNNVEKNPEWLAAAKSTIEFIEQHCFDTDGRMYFEVTAEGKPLRKRRYVFFGDFCGNSHGRIFQSFGRQELCREGIETIQGYTTFHQHPRLHGA